MQDMAKFGRKLVQQGLVESHLGNISVRKGGRMLITKSGTPLDEISEEGVVEVEIDKPSSLDGVASSETPVHRAIYRKTPSLAVIHAHPPFAVIESLLGEDRIVPLDHEGRYLLCEIPVIRGEFNTPELADNISDALKTSKGAVVFSHGTFAAGKTLEEAFIATALIEHSCKLKYYVDTAKGV